ncbi:Cro/CI family transcriptional regulator [Stutzerimonas stutzeri TS44]|nr:Cro/CI family transcriptional regulator [Stutzerimonas stutzeri TS44]
MGANPGETLRQARESKGWSLASVAQQLNLTARSVAQIEAGDFSQLPGHTFARGYVRAYAKLLELDPNRLVQEFDQHTGTSASGSNVTSLGRIEEPGRLSRSVIRFFGFALLLIVAAASFYWWQERVQQPQTAPAVTTLDSIEVETADGTTQIHLLDRPEEQEEAVDAPPVETVEQSSMPEPEPEPEPVAAPQLQEQGTPTPVDGASVAAAAEPVLPAAEPEEAAAPAAQVNAPVTETPSEPTVVPAAGEGRLVLQYSADCWTKVTDADGRVLYSGLAKAGSERVLTGKAPLYVHLGYARGAQISYNGAAVNLAPYVRGETARIKLGQ